MLHFSSKPLQLAKNFINSCRCRPKYLVLTCVAVLCLITSVIYALPKSAGDPEDETKPAQSDGILDNLFLYRNKAGSKKSGFQITDPLGSSSDPETALLNQFRYANNYGKFSGILPGDKFDFGYEIRNTGAEAIDIRETYYILSFVPQDPADLDFAMFRSFKPDPFGCAYDGVSPLTPHKLDAEGRLYSFTSDPYTLSGSSETIAGAPIVKRNQRYMVYDRLAGNETQGETVAIVITLGYKLHSSEEWQPSVTQTVISGGLTETTEYRTDTDVYLSCDIAALDYINPDNPGSVTFTVTDQTGKQTTLVYDDFNSPLVGIQRAYVPFHIPDATGDLTVSISSSKNVVCDTEKIVATVVSSEENTPPDPTTDTPIPVSRPLPTFKESTSHEWITYSARKTTSGQWEYEKQTHTASLNTDFKLAPDSSVKTAVGNTMSSGYGVNAEIKSEVSADGPIYNIQNVYCFFPEFDYKDYSRKLEISGQDALTTTWVFRPNQYSQRGSRAHYIPPAYPDGLYTIYATVRDAWTPVGELKSRVTAEVNIIGSLYDDWYVTEIN